MSVRRRVRIAVLENQIRQVVGKPVLDRIVAVEQMQHGTANIWASGRRDETVGGVTLNLFKNAPIPTEVLWIRAEKEYARTKGIPEEDVIFKQRYVWMEEIASILKTLTEDTPRGAKARKRAFAFATGTSPGGLVGQAIGGPWWALVLGLVTGLIAALWED